MLFACIPLGLLLFPHYLSLLPSMPSLMLSLPRAPSFSVPFFPHSLSPLSLIMSLPLFPSHIPSFSLPSFPLPSFSPLSPRKLSVSPTKNLFPFLSTGLQALGSATHATAAAHQMAAVWPLLLSHLAIDLHHLLMCAYDGCLQSSFTRLKHRILRVH